VPFGYIPRNQFNEKASPSGARMGNPPDSPNCCYIAITLTEVGDEVLTVSTSNRDGQST